MLFAGNDAFRDTRSAYDLLRDADNGPEGRIDRALPVFQVGTYDQTFPFYLRRTTTIVNFRDELALGTGATPSPTRPTRRSRCGARSGTRCRRAIGG